MLVLPVPSFHPPSTTPTINNLPAPGPLRKDLETALQTIRSPTQPQTLWIDVCALLVMATDLVLGDVVPDYGNAVGEVFRQAVGVVVQSPWKGEVSGGSGR
jgi:hypothetical protein